MNLAYCDAFASFIRKALISMKVEDEHFNTLSGLVYDITMDLHPEDGYFLSTKKTLDVTDAYGKSYRITVEEL